MNCNDALRVTFRRLSRLPEADGRDQEPLPATFNDQGTAKQEGRGSTFKVQFGIVADLWWEEVEYGSSPVLESPTPD